MTVLEYSVWGARWDFGLKPTSHGDKLFAFQNIWILSFDGAEIDNLYPIE